MKNHHKNSAVAFVALILAIFTGCAVPKSAESTAGIEQQVFRNDTTAAQTASIASLPWKKFLANPELAALIDTALLKNNDLQLAIKEIEIANESLKKAKNGLVPEVGVVVASSNSLPSDNSLNGLTANKFVGSNNLDNYTAALNVSWEADIWGKVKNQKREALAEYLKTKEAQKAVKTLLVSSVATAYYNLLMLDEQLQIAKRNLSLNDSTLHIIKLQYQSAQASSLAIEQTEAQKLVAAGLIPRLEKAINEQENALSVLAGIPPRSIRRSGSLDEIKVTSGFGAGLPAEMLSRRPDVKASELELQAANARIGLARANMYPAITISAQGGVNSLKASNWFSIPGALFGIVNGAVAAPLLQKRELRTQYNISVLKREQSVDRFRQSILTAFQEVSDALVGIDKLNSEQIIASERVNRLKSATRNAGYMYRNGMANYLDVITAQSNALSAELELASIRRAEAAAVIDLYRSLGGGWE
ncbi:efflux transporter outer membrane subunit [Mucilaginibacter sp. cycad4]|uniref:efflux transporter outer membrane subunit n=1 Tax=Mucilaginibacter sp. cycad4 TaxID=3342096 RepID=UPI002AAB24A9|nr:efflux transporter outer membrane subunit [Mucilaginibacter gossypii]WPU99172.1 efflux transporter outer membrane subunit [Mucilaginibacter gossypii]